MDVNKTPTTVPRVEDFIIQTDWDGITTLGCPDCPKDAPGYGDEPRIGTIAEAQQAAIEHLARFHQVRQS